MIDKFFIRPIAAAMEHQDKNLRGYRKNSEREYMLLCRTFLALEEPKGPITKMQFWLSNQNHKTSECSQLIALTVEECLKLVKQNEFYFNCLSNSYFIKGRIALSNGALSIETRPLLDCGLYATLFKEDIAKRLNLEGS